MYGFKAFYRGKSIEVYADTALRARDTAVAIFKAGKAYEVTVMLCEKDGVPVVHSAEEV